MLYHLLYPLSAEFGGFNGFNFAIFFGFFERLFFGLYFLGDVCFFVLICKAIRLLYFYCESIRLQLN